METLSESNLCRVHVHFLEFAPVLLFSESAPACTEVDAHQNGRMFYIITQFIQYNSSSLEFIHSVYFR